MSLIHLDLKFVERNWNGSICTLLHADHHLRQRHFLKCFLFSIESFWNHRQRSRDHRCVGLFKGLQFYFTHPPVCVTNTTKLFLTVSLQYIFMPEWWFTQKFLCCWELFGPFFACVCVCVCEELSCILMEIFQSGDCSCLDDLFCNQTPLRWSMNTGNPAIFWGLLSFHS